MLAVDTGDAPLGSAYHEAVGPILGELRDGSPLTSAGYYLATRDAFDEDGVTFSTLRAGDAGTMTVFVRNAPDGAKLDAWIDFGRDGNASHPGDQIADSLPVPNGETVVSFTVPASISGNYYFARVRLSTAGDLDPTGLAVAADGEVEDYAVAIAGADSGPFTGPQPFAQPSLYSPPRLAESYLTPVDFDSDGDVDMLTQDNLWFQNTAGRLGLDHNDLTVDTSLLNQADVDGDGDIDAFARKFDDLGWYERDGTQLFGIWHEIDSSVPSSLAALDSDGDGDVDLLTANGSTLELRTNDGQQNFSLPQSWSVASQVRSLTAADMNGDGVADAAAALANGQIVWYEFNGGHPPVPHEVVQTAANLRAIEAFDLDGDGDQDLLAASNGSGGLVWYENDGAGIFTSHALDATPWGAESFVVADLDADGDLDVAAAGKSRVAWYENDGSQTFAPHVIAQPQGTLLSIVAADVDGDGRIDLITGADGAGVLSWYRHEGVHDYGDAPRPYPTQLADNGARHVPTGPRLGATRDGSHDLSDADDDGVTFGSIQVGQLQGTLAVDVQNAPAGAKLAAWIDFDGDGSWGGAEERIFSALPVVEGENLLTYSIPSGAVAGTTYARVRLTTAGMLSPSGGATDGEVEDYQIEIAPRAPATGLFGEGMTAVAGSSNTSGFGFMITADVDGDGDVDIVTKTSGNNLAWSENRGAAGFEFHEIPNSTLANEDFAAADLDGDGDVDLVGNSYVSGPRLAQLVWMENDGSGSFTRHIGWEGPIPQFGESLGLGPCYSVADIDADGDLDVLTCDGTYTSAWLNNGRQEFTPYKVGDGGWGAIVTVDMDGDGNLDVVVGGKKIIWFRNDGELNFAEQFVLDPRNPYAATTEGLAPGDIDGDGDLDLLSVQRAWDSDLATVRWHEQTSDGSFVSHELASDSAEDWSRWATLADFDGDGDLDILHSAFVNDRGEETTIDLYDNLGGGQFLRRTIDAALDFSTVVTAAADMDGDGDLDAVVLTRGNGAEVIWYANEGLVDPDYGDAPVPFATLHADGGAVHVGVGPRLGALRDVEANGAPSVAADAASDDDGVALPVIQIGQASGVAIVNVQNAPAGAKLDGWIDFNQDGSWDGAGERIFASRPVTEGDNHLSFVVPAIAAAGEAAARFRLSTAGALRPGGAARDGEVEDYLVTIVPAAVATGEFGGRRILSVWSPEFDETLRFQPADLDGDGDQDFVVSSVNWSIPGWVENLGDGAFMNRSLRFGGGFAPVGLSPADVDGDGDVDLVGPRDGGGIVWAENDGAGEFEPHFGGDAGIRPNGLFDLADVNGDGSLDLLVARRVTSSTLTERIAVFLNDGQQNWSLSQPVTTPALTPIAIRSADIDGDGDADFAVAFERGSSGWYENFYGRWIYHELTPIAETEPGHIVLDIVPVDFDRDGDQDLMTLVYDMGQLALDLYRNDGGANLVREVLASTPMGLGQLDTYGIAERLQVADLDGDGDFDAVATGSWRGTYIYRNDGADGLTQFLVMENEGPTTAERSVAVADFDGDGRLEILAYGLSYDGYSLLDDLPFGDYDRSGGVDGGDFLQWQRTLGEASTSPGAGADGNRSGGVDPQDLAVWQTQLGQRVAPNIRVADVDLNERVNGADFLAWQRGFGTTPPDHVHYYLSHDFNFSGTTDGEDLAIWQRHYGAAVVTASAVTVAATTLTAEPASVPVNLLAVQAVEPEVAAASLRAANGWLVAPQSPPVAGTVRAVPPRRSHFVSERDEAFAALAVVQEHAPLRDDRPLRTPQELSRLSPREEGRANDLWAFLWSELGRTSQIP